jgi:hypothetical protein
MDICLGWQYNIQCLEQSSAPVKFGRQNVVVPLPPNLVPIREYKAEFVWILIVAPLQTAQP